MIEPEEVNLTIIAMISRGIKAAVPRRIPKIKFIPLVIDSTLFSQ